MYYLQRLSIVVQPAPNESMRDSLELIGLSLK